MHFKIARAQKLMQLPPKTFCGPSLQIVVKIPKFSNLGLSTLNFRQKKQV